MIVMLVLMVASAGPGEDIPSLFREARDAEQRREFSTALEKYNRVLAIDPRIAEVWANKGLVLHELERRREALRAFERAAELKPSLLVPQLFRGLEHLHLGEPAEAIAPLEAALALAPGHAEALNALAHACLETGQFERAVGLFRQVIARGDAAEEPYYGLAVAYLNWSKSTARKLVEASSPYGALLEAEYLAATGLAEPSEAKRRSAQQALARRDSPSDRALYEF
jgi:tetratricopeptide (TPR) repeat protein